MHSNRLPFKKGTPHLTTHTLDVVHPFGFPLSLTQRRELTNLTGVHRLTCDLESGHLEVTYNLDKIHLESIENYMLVLGYIRKGGLAYRVRNHLAHFAERADMEIYSWSG